MRVKFSRDFDYVTPQKTIAFKSGMEETVAQDVAKAAMEAKAAVEVKPEPTKAKNGE